jgi:hypothetical protein
LRSSPSVSPGATALDRRGQRRAAREQLDRRVERRVGVVHDDELALGVRLAREVADREREARQRAFARDRQRADQHAGSKMRAMRTSAIVTYRGADGSERRANLDAVLAWLAATPDVEAIVVEQDAFPRLSRRCRTRPRASCSRTTPARSTRRGGSTSARDMRPAACCFSAMPT